MKTLMNVKSKYEELLRARLKELTVNENPKVRVLLYEAALSSLNKVSTICELDFLTFDSGEVSESVNQLKKYLLALNRPYFELLLFLLGEEGNGISKLYAELNKCIDQEMIERN